MSKARAAKVGAVPFSGGGAVAYDPGPDPDDAQRRLAETTLRAIDGVTGVGLGNGVAGDPAWIAYVTDRQVAGQLPQIVAGLPVVVEVTGIIDAG